MPRKQNSPQSSRKSSSSHSRKEENAKDLSEKYLAYQNLQKKLSAGQSLDKHDLDILEGFKIDALSELGSVFYGNDDGAINPLSEH